MSLSPARRVAFDILRRVEAEGAYASDLLHAELTSKIKRPDAALATELTLGVLRWRRLLDFLLERHLKKPVADLDLEVALALRIGLYQLRFLERIPTRAAVNESVELAKQGHKSSASSLVNAVLRRVLEEAREPVEGYLAADSPKAQRYGIIHSHPDWMVERWLKHYGEARTLALLEANNRPANLAVAVHLRERGEEILNDLGAAGLQTQPGKLLRSATLVSGGSPARSQVFQKGWISVQDEASQVIPILLTVKSGQSVLDVCAAPGGKTVPLARAAGPSGFVVATDRHTHRLRALRANLERCGLRNVPLVELDAEKPLPFNSKFDGVLVDAPCSGTGTLARHPEIRWRLRPEAFREFHRRQVRLLRSALPLLAPGGRLVYATCSLEPEENEEVVADSLRGMPHMVIVAATETAVALEPHLAAGIAPKNLFDSNGFFRSFPPIHTTDGFFAAVIERVHDAS
jgi:16S rRNA (cytosine967-C5)-methyltransferase